VTSQSLEEDQSSATEDDCIPQPEDPEEIELKQDISQILEQKALLKKELKDTVPEGLPCHSLILSLDRKVLVAILSLLEEIEPCLKRAQLYSKHFCSSSDDADIEDWLPSITDELCDAFHLLEQWEEELGDSTDMARQFPDLEERSAIRGKMDSLHEAFYQLREKVLTVLWERMSQMTNEIPEEVILKFTRICINIPCISARYWIAGADKHHFEQLRHFFDDRVLPSECIAEFCCNVFGAMKFNTHMDMLREIYNQVFERVHVEVEKHSGWDIRGHFEVKEPFDWKAHQHQKYFQAILPLDLYSHFARTKVSDTSTSDLEKGKTLFERHGTTVIYRWMEFVNGYRLLSKANEEYKSHWPNEGPLTAPFDFDSLIKSYAMACQKLRDTDLGGFAQRRIGLIQYSLLGERYSAKRAFESALKNFNAENPTDPYYNTGWAIQSRDYLARISIEEKAEAELKAKQEAECAEKQRQEREESERQAKLQKEKQEQEKMNFYLTHNLDVLGFKTMEVHGAQTLLGLLRWVTETFVPPDEEKRQRLEELVKDDRISRSKFMKIIMVYHPDKNSKQNEFWKKASEEVTKVLHYGRWLI